MYFHHNLLTKFADITHDPRYISDQLTHKTCEVEHLVVREIPDLVVIWKVIQCIKHPNADTLFVCQVDCGHHGVFQIITGGINIASDIYVPVALPGCHLPMIDLTISHRTMRWLESNGMICSKWELWIHEDEDQHWIWILQRNTTSIDADALYPQQADDMSDIVIEDIGIWLAHKYPRLNNRIIEVDNKTLTHRPDLTWHRGLAQEIKIITSLSSVSS